MAEWSKALYVTVEVLLRWEATSFDLTCDSSHYVIIAYI